MKRNRQHDSLSDKIYRYRGVILVISVPLLLISCVLFLMPAREDSIVSNRKIAPNFGRDYKYAVIFDAGSSGSRVHVFCFDKHLDLVPIGNDLELFLQLKPGLSAYAKDPKAAAHSLQPLLEKAEAAVPRELRRKTAVRVGATAGLRQLEGDASDRILQAVRDYLKVNSKLKSKSDWVTVLDGSQEGAYQWVTINYLLGRLGKTYSDTVGVVDLGGGSVQMAYAISESDAAKAPKLLALWPIGSLRFLKLLDSGSPCIVPDYNGSYTYGGTVYKVSHSPSGSSKLKCREVATEALNVNATCTHIKCTFGGVWNGGGGGGERNLFVASFFYDRAAEAGLIDPKKPVAKVRPVDFEDAATRACQTNLKEAKSIYSQVKSDDLPFLCMDLVYQFTLLVDGFALDPLKEITLVKQVKYQNSLVEAAWPLGSAIDVVSSS